MAAQQSAILMIHCPDRTGLVAGVSEFLHQNGGNILHLDQHVDPEQGMFFMRVQWDLADFSIPGDRIEEYFGHLVARKFDMDFELHFLPAPSRMAVFVSRLSHCLYDILSRCSSGEWDIEVPVIISNHPDLAQVAEQFGIDYHVFPVTRDNKHAQEQRELELLRDYDVDFVVLARYMQILSPDFIAGYRNRILNIHHSFLPAFPGARPYHSAHARGVKIIGATSHYVTSELDAGPIVEQEVTRVSHVDSVQDLIRKGRDLEKLVLARAIWHHHQHKVLVYGNRTVIFE
jgi:formyltetrahydrofolate deformylase